MRFLYSLLGLLASVIAVCAYVYLNAQQLMHFITEMPNCFPPYVLMSEPIGHVPNGTYLGPLGQDEGFDTPCEEVLREPPSY